MQITFEAEALSAVLYMLVGKATLLSKQGERTAESLSLFNTTPRTDKTHESAL